MQYTFNKIVQRKFYPEVGGRSIQLPDQTPTIYLFTSLPSLSAAAAGTGAAQTISAWTQEQVAPYTCSYQFAAVADPDATSALFVRTYYEALRFRTTTSGTIETVIRSFEIERVAVPDSTLEVAPIDLKKAYPAIGSYLTDQELEEFITIATDEIKLLIERKDVDWSTVQFRNKFNLAVAYKAIELSALSQIREDNDKHDIRVKAFASRCQMILDLIEVTHDTDRDGSNSDILEPNRGYVVGYK